jgi:hypothetical protein
MRASAASSQAGSWPRHDSQAATTSAGRDRPAPLAEGGQVLPEREGPVCEGLIYQHFCVLCEGSNELVVTVASGPHAQRGHQIADVALEVYIEYDVSRGPDAGPVGFEQSGCWAAEAGKNPSRHGQSPGERSGRLFRYKISKENIARSVATYSAPGADKDELTEVLSRRTGPRSGLRATTKDRERPEQLGPDGLRRLVWALDPFCGHAPLSRVRVCIRRPRAGRAGTFREHHRVTLSRASNQCRPASPST